MLANLSSGDDVHMQKDSNIEDLIEPSREDTDILARAPPASQPLPASPASIEALPDKSRPFHDPMAHLERFSASLNPHSAKGMLCAKIITVLKKIITPLTDNEMSRAGVKFEEFQAWHTAEADRLMLLGIDVDEDALEL